jgi:hypothetical protein
MTADKIAIIILALGDIAICVALYHMSYATI